MLKRTITALVGILIFIPICILSGTGVFVFSVAAVTIIAVHEMIKCIGATKDYPVSVPVYILATAVPASVRLFSSHGLFILAYASVLFLLLLYFFAVSVFAKGKYGLERIAMIYVTSLYIITAFSSIILLRDKPNGQYIYLLAIVGPWVSDIFAYLTGNLLGRHKLIPEVSPKKTVEGCIGGIVFCAVFFVLYGCIISAVRDIRPEYLFLFVTGLFVSVIAQIGDLIASLIKRQYHIKDYGNIFPGHGGVIDRFDSVLSTAPFLLIICSVPGVFDLFL